MGISQGFGQTMDEFKARQNPVKKKETGGEKAEGEKAKKKKKKTKTILTSSRGANLQEEDTQAATLLGQ